MRIALERRGIPERNFRKYHAPNRVLILPKNTTLSSPSVYRGRQRGFEARPIEDRKLQGELREGIQIDARSGPFYSCCH